VFGSGVLCCSFGRTMFSTHVRTIELTIPPEAQCHYVTVHTAFFLESIIYRLRNTLNGNRPSWSFDPGPAQPPTVHTASASVWQRTNLSLYSGCQWRAGCGDQHRANRVFSRLLQIGLGDESHEVQVGHSANYCAMMAWQQDPGSSKSWK
jgi:hypothetical protein